MTRKQPVGQEIERENILIICTFFPWEIGNEKVRKYEQNYRESDSWGKWGRAMSRNSTTAQLVSLMKADNQASQHNSTIAPTVSSSLHQWLMRWPLKWLVMGTPQHSCTEKNLIAPLHLTGNKTESQRNTNVLKIIHLAVDSELKTKVLNSSWSLIIWNNITILGPT